MGKDKYKKKSATISDYHVKLGELLQKKRTRAKANEVEKVIQMDIDPEEKIELIDEIDNELKPVRTSSGNKARFSNYEEKPVKGESILSQSAAKELRKEIKLKFNRSGIIKYLFRDYKKIREFSRGTSFLKNSIIPPRIYFDTEIVDIFFKRIYNDADSILECLQHVLTLGWMHLEKNEYNLIVQLKKLCEKILTINLAPIKLKNYNILARYRSLETNFFACNYYKWYPDLIISKVTQILGLYPELGINRNKINALIKTIINTAPRDSSLATFIIGVNMVQYRRLFDFRELYWSRHQSILNEHDFECNDRVRKKINDFINKSVKELQELLNQKSNIDQLGKYIPITSENKYDFKLLENFYDSIASESRNRYEQDLDNIIVFIPNLFEAFIKVYDKFLCDRVSIPTDGKIYIFEPDLFQFELSKIQLSLQKLTKYKYSNPEFSRKEFISLINSREEISGPKSEVVELVKDILNKLKLIVNKLIEIENRHSPAFGASKDESNDPLSVSALNKNSLVIPYWDRKVDDLLLPGDRSVKQCITELITISLLIDILIYDGQTDHFITSRDRINSEIEKIKQVLKRVATGTKYERLKKKHNF